MYECQKCHKVVTKVFPIDDAEASAESTMLIEVESPMTYYLCLTCVKEHLGIYYKDLIEEEIFLNKDTEFQLNLLKGKVAQSIIETIFLEFGYEVYPYGYESYLTNIIKHMKKENANDSVMKIRSTPDLYIYDRANNEGNLIEVKASNTPNEGEYWIPTYTADRYQKYWGEAILLVYCITTGNIFGCPIEKISFNKLKLEMSPNKKHNNYVINLKDDFYTLPDLFSRIDQDGYMYLMEEIKEILNKFSQD